jgi:SAM-dependent methyltransferase
LLRVGASPKTLLDVACGTGTVAELLTLVGYHVTGFDLSEPMIHRAREKAAQKNLKIDYLVADATTFDLENTFEGAYSFFDSLNYITTSEGLRAAIERVGLHLPPGATFIFDLNTAYAFEQRMFDQRDLRKKAPVRYQWKGNYDRATRIIEVDMTFWRGEEEFKEVHVQRAHPMEEVRAALADAGFDRVEFFASYSLDLPTRRSDRVHCVAHRL